METFECSPSPVDNSCGILPLPCPPPAQIPAFCKDTSFITTHQHSPNDQVRYITLTYAATIARVIAGSREIWRALSGISCMYTSMVVAARECRRSP